jgi:hypothetical protein
MACECLHAWESLLRQFMYMPDCCIAQASRFCRYETALGPVISNELKHFCRAIDQSEWGLGARASHSLDRAGWHLYVLDMLAIITQACNVCVLMDSLETLGRPPRVEVTNFSGIGHMQWSCNHVPRMPTSTQFASIAATARLYAAGVVVTFTDIIMPYAEAEIAVISLV